MVGRNLSVWGLGGIGHVGMWTGSQVLEFLNEGTFIYQNTLASFKARDKYWGAKYGVGASKSAKIVSAGWGQRSFSPSYTRTTSWREGGIAQQVCIQYDRYGKCVRFQSSVSTALFRCDTFVNYSFIKGNGASLVGYTILPSILYNSLPSTR